MIDTDKYEELIEDANLDTYECVFIAKELLAEVKRLRGAVECMRFDIEHAIEHSWASWEDLKAYLKKVIE